MFFVFEWICILVGAHQLLKLACYLHNIVFTLISKQNFAVYGQGAWALVTGATDGIGKGFARELARNGFNIILVSRNAQKLRDTAQEIRSEFGVNTQVVEADFGKCAVNPIHFFTTLHDQVKDKDIGILVNNVGTGEPGFFTDISFDDILRMNALNLWPIVMLTRLIAPSMLKRPQKGLIVNLGSIASVIVLPASAVYCGGKSFDLHLSNIMALDLHLAEKNNAGIDVLCLKPGYVDTPLTKNAKSKPLEISAKECARHGLKAAGSVVYTNGHWKHILVEIVMRLFRPLVPISFKI